MLPRRQDIALTTDASGNVTAFSAAINGRVLAVIYTKNNFAAGVDITISTENTLQTIVTLTDINASAVKYPRVLVQDAVGADTTLREPVYVANERVKIVVAQGGNTLSGTITLVIG